MKKMFVLFALLVITQTTSPRFGFHGGWGWRGGWGVGPYYSSPYYVDPYYSPLGIATDIAIAESMRRPKSDAEVKAEQDDKERKAIEHQIKSLKKDIRRAERRNDHRLAEDLRRQQEKLRDSLIRKKSGTNVEFVGNNLRG